MFFYGVDATKKPTAAPLDADNTYRSTFLCPQEESNLRAFFLGIKAEPYRSKGVITIRVRLNGTFNRRQNRAVIWRFGQLVTTPASQGAWWQAPARRSSVGGSGRLRARALPDLCLGIISGRLGHLDP